MAIQTKTIYGSTSSSQWTWKMEIIENSYSIENNTSSVIVKSYLGRASSQSYFGGTASLNITCNGESRGTSKTFPYPTYVNGGAWLLVQEETFTVGHNDDGSKTISVSSSLSTGDFNPNSASASGDMQLTTIPRASSVSVSNYDLGQNINIVIGKKISSFYTTLKYEIGKLTGTIINHTSQSNYLWVMSNDLKNQIKTNYPNTSKVLVKIYCETYQKNFLTYEQIGETQSATFTLTIIDIPTIENIVIEEQNTIVSGLTTDIVKYVSKPKITVSATAPYGTTIKKYYFLKGDTTYNSDTNEYILENIQDSFMDEDILKTRFTVYVEDNRGNVSLETIEDRKFIDYVNSSINTTDIKLGRLTNVSNTVKLSLTGFVYNGLIGDSQNTVSVKYRYKLQSSDKWSSFTTIPTTLEGNTFKITDLELAGEFDYRENYNFEFYATDLLQTTPASTFLLSSTEYVYLFHKNGADFKSLTVKKKNIIGYEINDVIVTNTNVNPSERLGGTWELIDKEFKSENTNSNSFFDANTSNCIVNTFYITRSGHNISIRFNFDNKVALSDSTVALGSFNFSELGITELPFSLYYVVGATDDGNGLFMTYVNYSDGSTEIREVVTKTSGGTIPSNKSCYLLFEFATTYDRMLDSFCDKFYWKRIA